MVDRQLGLISRAFCLNFNKDSDKWIGRLWLRLIFMRPAKLYFGNPIILNFFHKRVFFPSP
jgi:hypothetical protein